MAAFGVQATGPGGSERVAWRRVALFYGIAFGMVCLLGAAFALARVDMTKGTPALAFQLTVAFLYMPMPLVAGIVVERVAGRRLLLRSTFADFRNTWWRIAVVSAGAAVAMYLVNGLVLFVLGNVLHVPGVGVLASTQAAAVANLRAVLGAAASGVDLSKGMPSVAALYVLGLVSGVLAGFSVNGLFAFGEEYGWRGVLADELVPLGPVRANLLTGVMWGLWHAPMILLGFNYGVDRWAGVAMMCVWLVPFSFLLWRARQYSGSVISAAIIHGAFNGSAGFYLILLGGGVRLWTAPVGLLGAVDIAIVAAGVWALTRGRLYEAPASSQPAIAEATPSSAM
jgi:uncharacterized protein